MVVRNQFSHPPRRYLHPGKSEADMKIGAHVSTAGGISKAVDRGADIGCETIQIFGSSPQSWAFKPVPDAEIDAFRAKSEETGMAPAFLHAIYLINMGTPNQVNLEKGIQSLVNYMTLASEIGAGGVIFHPGSHKGVGYDAIFEQAVAGIRQVLDQSPEGPYLCLENMAGMGQHIGAKFAELGRIIRAVDSPRLRICLDTQHSFAAGYDLTTADGVDAMMAGVRRRHRKLTSSPPSTPTTPSSPAAPASTATTTSARASSARKGSRP